MSLASPRPLGRRSCVCDGSSSGLVFFLEAAGGGAIRAGHAGARSMPEETASLVSSESCEKVIQDVVH